MRHIGSGGELGEEDYGGTSYDAVPDQQFCGNPYSVDTFRGSIDTPVTLSIDGRPLEGSTSFSYAWGLGTSMATMISGTLTPTRYTVAVAIPEPSTRLRLAAGLAGIAAARPLDSEQGQRNRAVLKLKQPAFV